MIWTPSNSFKDAKVEQKTVENVWVKSSKMPKKKFDDIKKLPEIVDLAELLQIDYDENCTIQEIKSKLKQKVEDQSKYLKRTTVCCSDWIVRYLILAKSCEFDAEKH